MVKEMVMVLFSGTTVKNSREIGKMESNVGLGYGDRLKVTLIRGNGVIIGNTAKAFSNIKTAHTEANTKIS